MNDGSAFQKRRKLLDMLDRGLVMVHLDPRPEDVIVPGYLKADPVLRLNLAYGFRLPALDIGAEGVYAVLSFNKQNFGCTLPWHAVFALTRPDNGHDGMVWPGSLPPELRPMTSSGTTSAAGVELSAASAGSGSGSDPEAEDFDEVPDSAGSAETHGAGPGHDPATSPRPAAPPLFKVHTGGQAEAPPPSPEPEAGGEAPPPPRAKSHLRLVKG